jgi:hypothetical protein
MQREYNVYDFLGEMSPFLVKSGTIAKIPVQDNCYHLCRCGMTGLLTDCQHFCDQSSFSDCSLNNYNITHLTQMSVNTRKCICFNGNIHCIDRYF